MKAGVRRSSVLEAMCSPSEAAAAMVSRVSAVGVERLAVEAAAGRVLAERVCADRDSPAADVSAMDGFAVCFADVVAMASGLGDGESLRLSVSMEVSTGRKPGALVKGTAARIFTGGVLPAGADTVVRREAVEELVGAVVLPGSAVGGSELALGKYVRKRGAHALEGGGLLEVGSVLGPAALSALASVGLSEVWVYRKVLVGLAVSGDELGQGADGMGVARVRDSNGPALRGLVSGSGCCEVGEVVRLADDLESTRLGLAGLLDRCDVVLTTGGVSMGDHDWLPAALAGLCEERGGAVVYHHLAMRPGKPNLGVVVGGDADGVGGVPVLGLPGNPMSVLVGAVVLGGPVIRARAGMLDGVGWGGRLGWVVEADAGRSEVAKRLGLWHYRPAVVGADGGLRAVGHRGSGDVAGLGRSSCFFEVPPNEASSGVRRVWDWRLD